MDRLRDLPLTPKLRAGGRATYRPGYTETREIKMRNLFVVIALLMAVAVGAQEKPAFYDETFSYLIASDARASGEEKQVLLINTNFTGIWEFDRMLIGFSRFAEYAEDQGFEVKKEYLNSITDASLYNVDVLFTAGPPGFSENEKVILRNFLRNGGRVVLSLCNSLFLEYDLWKYSNFTAEYGIGLSDGYLLHSYPAVPPSSPFGGPLKCKILESSGSKIVTQKLSGKVTLAAGNVVAEIHGTPEIGKGRLVVSGDYEIFVSVYMRFKDNESFSRNMLYYLYGTYDLGIILAKYSGKKLVPGGEIKLISKVKNYGTSPSTQTKIGIYLSSTETLSLSAPRKKKAVLIELLLQDIDAINPNKKKRIKEKVDIPDTVEPGEYYLIYVIDPGMDGGDFMFRNNIKNASKMVTIE